MAKTELLRQDPSPELLFDVLKTIPVKKIGGGFITFSADGIFPCNLSLPNQNREQHIASCLKKRVMPFTSLLMKWDPENRRMWYQAISLDDSSGEDANLCPEDYVSSKRALLGGGRFCCVNYIAEGSLNGFRGMQQVELDNLRQADYQPITGNLRIILENHSYPSVWKGAEAHLAFDLSDQLMGSKQPLTLKLIKQFTSEENKYIFDKWLEEIKTKYPEQ